MIDALNTIKHSRGNQGYSCVVLEIIKREIKFDWNLNILFLNVNMKKGWNWIKCVALQCKIKIENNKLLKGITVTNLIELTLSIPNRSAILKIPR